MDDFAIPNYSCNEFGVPNHTNNYIQPGKRPVSSMVPAICVDKEKDVRLVLGGSGGTRILTSCSMVAARNLLLDDSLLNCVNSHRVHNQLWPDEVLFEDGLSSV
jgi:gamma-glutamyltranspeptidase/glutathione hydrolase/leukotriene-C4 hydrolase